MSSKAVIQGRIQHISPSQIRSFTDCNRKWWWEKVAGIEIERKAHFETGERLHSQMEVWFLNGVPPANQSALLLSQHPDVPQPHPELLIEYPKDFATNLKAAGVPVKGKIDLLDPRQKATGLIAIWDWKSSSNFNGKGIKTADYLTRDIQLNIYSKYVFSQWPEAEKVTLSHGYMLTKGGFAAKVVTTEPLDREHISDVYNNIEQIIEKMKDAASQTDYRLVTPNYEQCEEYGGCPYKRNCGIGQVSLLDTDEGTDVTKEEHKEFVAKLKAQKRTGVLPPDAPPPSKEPVAKQVLDTRKMVRIYYTLDGQETFIQIPAKTQEEAVAAAKQFVGPDIQIKGMEVL